MDSLRQDHVSFYNKEKNVFPGVLPSRTPNIDLFARESVAFDSVYPSGLPTIPQRTELITGQFTLPYRGWQPLYPSDLTVAGMLRRRGYVTGLVSDTYHMFKPGYNFFSYMDSWEFIRGQEYDMYGLLPPLSRQVKDYSNESLRSDQGWMYLLQKFLANIDAFRDDHDEDWFPAKVFSAASSWLRRNLNHNGHIFLWVDSFDPHEPWEHPHKYDSPYRPEDKKPRIILPKGGQASEWANEDEINDIRALYAGEVLFVDKWFGEFYRSLRETDVLDRSIVVLLADHGHPLADHGKFLKGADRLYNELLKIPFMIRMPPEMRSEFGGPRLEKTLAMIPDVLPTVLDLAGYGEDSVPLAGKSLLQVLKGEGQGRKSVVIGYHDAQDRCVRNERYSFIKRPAGQPDELFDLIEDAKETNNIIDERPEEAIRLAKTLGSIWMTSSMGPVRGIQGKYELARVLAIYFA